MRTAIPLSLIFLFSTCFTGLGRLTAEETGCRDFLRAFTRTPPYISFLGCKRRADLQGSPVEARYQVRGRYAAKAEQYLIKNFNIQKLNRSCCVWESVANTYRDLSQHSFLISMST